MRISRITVRFSIIQLDGRILITIVKEANQHVILTMQFSSTSVFLESCVRQSAFVPIKVYYDSCNPFQLYESVYRKLPLHCPYKATQYANAGIRKVLWSNNEGKHQTPDSLGSLLSHQQEILVSQTRWHDRSYQASSNCSDVS